MDELIIEKLTNIEQLLAAQSLLKKDVLNFEETCRYLDISQSHLYKLTSTKQIPHFCPQGKRLYFNRVELDEWLQRNRQASESEIDKAAVEYIIRNRHSKR